jgi:hypothetical protein
MDAFQSVVEVTVPHSWDTAFGNRWGKVTPLDVATAMGSMYSGYSTTFRAAMALNTDTLMNTRGEVLDRGLTNPEIIAQLFGVTTYESQLSYEVGKDIRKAKGTEGGSYTTGDVKLWYNEFKRYMHRKPRTKEHDKMDLAGIALSEGTRVFRDKPRKFQTQLVELIKADAQAGDKTYLEGIAKATGWMTPEDWKNTVNKITDPEVRDALMQLYEAKEQ